MGVGDVLEGYWPDDDQWLSCTIVAENDDGSFKIAWEDGTESEVPSDYVRNPGETDEVLPEQVEEHEEVPAKEGEELSVQDDEYAYLPKMIDGVVVLIEGEKPGTWVRGGR